NVRTECTSPLRSGPALPPPAHRRQVLGARERGDPGEPYIRLESRAALLPGIVPLPSIGLPKLQPRRTGLPRHNSCPLLLRGGEPPGSKSEKDSCTAEPVFRQSLKRPGNDR